MNRPDEITIGKLVGGFLVIPFLLVGVAIGYLLDFIIDSVRRARDAVRWDNLLSEIMRNSDAI